MHIVQILLMLAVLFGAADESWAFVRFNVVTEKELSDLLVQRQRGEADFLLLNTLDEIIYKSRSIPGSINIPWSQIDRRMDELGENRDRLIITYCIGHR